MKTDSTDTSRIEFTPDIDRLMRIMFGVATVLVLAHLAVVAAIVLGHPTLFGLADKFNLSLEATVPSFYSACLLLLAAGCAALLGAVGTRRKEPRAGVWHLVCAGLVFMAFDEASALHEQLVHPTQALLGGEEGLGLLHFAWVVPVGVFILALVPMFIPFIRGLDRLLRRRCLVAAALFLAGALGMEMLEGAHVEIHGRDWIYLLMVTVEEGAEMCALTLFMGAALRHLKRHGPATVALRLN